MSLVRTALVLGVLVYAMPTDPQKQQALIHSASDTLVWAATYCDREPETCRQAGAVWSQVVLKAKFGVALASDLASKWSEERSKSAMQRPAQSTLTIEDTLAVPPDEQTGPTAADPTVNG